jgi:hypothetical protein
MDRPAFVTADPSDGGFHGLPFRFGEGTSGLVEARIAVATGGGVMAS